MSVRVMAWVWEHSTSPAVPRLVLLAIADCANDAGEQAYPSTATLAQKTNLSERGVRGALAKLVELGELSVDYKAGPRGCNRYRVIMTDPASRAGFPAATSGNPAPRAASDTRHETQGTRHHVPGTRHETTVDPAPRAPEPSENHQHPSEEPSMSDAQKTRRRTSRPPPVRSDVDRICRHLADRIEANGSKRPTITRAWLDAGRRLIDLDHRTVDQVIKAIDWCQGDDFWRPNVMSMPKLRQKYDQLRLAAQRNGGARASPNGQTEHHGLMLNDRTIADLQRRERLAALDAANAQPAIGGAA